METNNLLQDMDVFDMDIWYKTNDPNFVEINVKSRVPLVWLSYKRILEETEYKDSILKPINYYIYSLGVKPSLVSIDGNTVRLRQGNHAEIYLMYERDLDKLWTVDRPWQRQFYNTEIDYDGDEDCIEKAFKFYTPWIIDADVEIRYEQVSPSPFKIVENTQMWSKPGEDVDFLEPQWVPFQFYRVGDHMEDRDFGIVPINMPMYDMVFEADDIIVERVREFYEHN